MKERNMLLSERLYYKQVGLSQPDGDRLLSVRRTMAAIKVVLGERERAAKALLADAARAKRVHQAVRKVLAPGEVEKEQTARAAAVAQAAKAEEEGLSAEEVEKRRDEAAAKAAEEARRKNVKVTFKRFGRKYTVPLDEAPTRPTNQQRKVAYKKTRYMRNLQQRSALVLSAQEGLKKRAAEAAGARSGAGEAPLA